jgi:hypothetical protein
MLKETACAKVQKLKEKSHIKGALKIVELKFRK